jgi:heat shock protein HtpX
MERMRKTLPEQIAANKRASYVFAFLLVLLLAALGTVIVGAIKPSYWYFGTVGATLLGAIVSVVALTKGSDIILSISHAREANGIEDRILNNVAEEMAIAGGIPKPRIYIIDDSAPNAFATGNDPQHGVVVFTTGILDKLDRDELQGVMAHEMAHIRNYDIRFMTAIALIAGLIPMLADFFMHMMYWGGGGRRSSRDRDEGGAQMIFVVVGLVLAILAPIFAVLLQLAVSRQREFLADASAAEMTRYPEGLARALQKIAGDPEPLEAANRATQHMYIINPLKGHGVRNLFSTHPSTEERIERLMGLMGSYQGGVVRPAFEIADSSQDLRT